MVEYSHNGLEGAFGFEGEDRTYTRRRTIAGVLGYIIRRDRRRSEMRTLEQQERLLRRIGYVQTRTSFLKMVGYMLRARLQQHLYRLPSRYGYEYGHILSGMGL